eukprot:GHVN01055304.1.p1 GENE.GHVN01055304.1~~GHVN01055304.1.p1  ORF type:complete len:1200 (-),score=300.98 GHVN01055304.1:159-3281(-)
MAPSYTLGSKYTHLGDTAFERLAIGRPLILAKRDLGSFRIFSLLVEHPGDLITVTLASNAVGHAVESFKGGVSPDPSKQLWIAQRVESGFGAQPSLSMTVTPTQRGKSENKRRVIYFTLKLRKDGYSNQNTNDNTLFVVTATSKSDYVNLIDGADPVSVHFEDSLKGGEKYFTFESRDPDMNAVFVVELSSLRSPHIRELWASHVGVYLLDCHRHGKKAAPDEWQSSSRPGPNNHDSRAWRNDRNQLIIIAADPWDASLKQDCHYRLAVTLNPHHHTGTRHEEALRPLEMRSSSLSISVRAHLARPGASLKLDDSITGVLHPGVPLVYHIYDGPQFSLAFMPKLISSEYSVSVELCQPGAAGVDDMPHLVALTSMEAALRCANGDIPACDPFKPLAPLDGVQHSPHSVLDVGESAGDMGLNLATGMGEAVTPLISRKAAYLVLFTPTPPESKIPLRSRVFTLTVSRPTSLACLESSLSEPAITALYQPHSPHLPPAKRRLSVVWSNIVMTGPQLTMGLPVCSRIPDGRSELRTKTEVSEDIVGYDIFISNHPHDGMWGPGKIETHVMGANELRVRDSHTSCGWYMSEGAALMRGGEGREVKDTTKSFTVSGVSQLHHIQGKMRGGGDLDSLSMIIAGHLSIFGEWVTGEEHVRRSALLNEGEVMNEGDVVRPNDVSKVGSVGYRWLGAVESHKPAKAILYKFDIPEDLTVGVTYSIAVVARTGWEQPHITPQSFVFNPITIAIHSVGEEPSSMKPDLWESSHQNGFFHWMGLMLEWIVTVGVVGVGVWILMIYGTGIAKQLARWFILTMERLIEFITSLWGSPTDLGQSGVGGQQAAYFYVGGATEMSGLRRADGSGSEYQMPSHLAGNVPVDVIRGQSERKGVMASLSSGGARLWDSLVGGGDEGGGARSMGNKRGVSGGEGFGVVRYGVDRGGGYYPLLVGVDGGGDDEDDGDEEFGSADPNIFYSSPDARSSSTDVQTHKVTSVFSSNHPTPINTHTIPAAPQYPHPHTQSGNTLKEKTSHTSTSTKTPPSDPSQGE